MGKKKRRAQRTAVAPPRDLMVGLVEAETLMLDKQWEEARLVLERLAHRYPRDPEVLAELVNVCYEMHDFHGYLRACRRLLEVNPDDPDLTLGLAGAYLLTLRPVQALRTFRRVLERWPDHERAAEVRAQVEELEPLVREVVAQTGLTGDDALELYALHEEGQMLVEQGDTAGAQRVISQLLHRVPEFVPALNNLSQVHAAEGQFDRAIEVAQRVLALDEDNAHALSNLTRYLVLSGRPGEAEETAARLKALSVERSDIWTKQAEALSYLGDDRGVLDAYHAAQSSSMQNTMLDPLLHHLAAVASMRLGEIDQARRYWKEALRLSPAMTLAQDNLDDLKLPVGERHAPWAFGFQNWVPRRMVEDLARQVASLSGSRSDQAVTRRVERFVRQYPSLNALVPVLLDRGDPEAREFGLRLAVTARTPEMLAALRDFALGQRGPDEMRHQAAQTASEGGLLPSGPVQLWQNGRWREVTLLTFQITNEPTERRPPEIQRLHSEANRLLRAGDGDRAAEVLTQARERSPDDVATLHNLAAAYELQGRSEEADELLQQIYEHDPDYLFVRVSLARKHLLRGEIEEAAALIDPLMSREKLHISEFDALASVQIEIALARGKRPAAESWLNMLEDVDPDAPNLHILRRRLASSGWKGLFRRG